VPSRSAIKPSTETLISRWVLCQRGLAGSLPPRTRPPILAGWRETGPPWLLCTCCSRDKRIIRAKRTVSAVRFNQLGDLATVLPVYYQRGLAGGLLPRTSPPILAGQPATGPPWVAMRSLQSRYIRCNACIVRGTHVYVGSCKGAWAGLMRKQCAQSERLCRSSRSTGSW
jgi:hypothetical protein